MTEFVKINVKEVLAIFSSLEKDINELDQTHKNISDNRDYSYTLKESILGEIQKLEKIKSSLLGLEIELPKGFYSKSIEKNNSKQIIGEIKIEQKPKKKNKY
jgi:hypothetical protein